MRGCKRLIFLPKNATLGFCRIPQQALLYQPYQDNSSVTSITRSGVALKETTGKQGQHQGRHGMGEKMGNHETVHSSAKEVRGM